MSDEKYVNETEMVTATMEQLMKADLMLCGRRKIFTSEEEFSEDNIVNVVNEILGLHMFNVMQEEYLYWYRRGVQPVLWRSREVRPELVKHIVNNNANQIVTFKNGYFMTAPASYSSRVDDEKITERVKLFNEYCLTAGKALADNEIVDWFHTVGLGVLYIDINREDDARRPFEVYSIDPRCGFNVYSYRPGNKRVLGVNIVGDNGRVMFDVWTKDKYYRLSGTLTPKTGTYPAPLEGTAINVDKMEDNRIGEIPIIEYQYDINRMSSFESAIPLCDAINEMQTMLSEGIEEQIQQLCVAVNCNFDEGVTANEIRKAGMIELRSTSENKASFEIIETKLSQAETQTNLDSLYEQLLDKTGLPNISRGDGGSSDNGSAVYLKSGYSIADTNRRNTEDFWRKSDEDFRRVALKIIKLKDASFDLDPSDFDLNIEPPTMSNLLVKTQSALNMRALGLAPQIWLERSGISNDPLTDIELSKDYIYQFYEMQNQTVATASAAEEPEIEQEGEALSDDRQVEELSSMVLD